MTKPKVLMVGPWPPATGGITTSMRNVVASASKDAYDFVPFTTFARRPGTCRLNDDRGAATYPLGHEELQAEVVHQFGGERLELVGESAAMMSDFHPSGFRAMA